MPWPRKVKSIEEQARRKTQIAGEMLVTAPAYIPVRMKTWLEAEAYRRNVPNSWVTLEIIALGIETYRTLYDDAVELLKEDAFNNRGG